MPTYGTTDRFAKDHAGLSTSQKAQFRVAVSKFIEDLDARRPLRKWLRVKRVKSAQGIFEMTWADDGRATFEYGDEQIDGEPHIIWRRVGTHDVLGSP